MGLAIIVPGVSFDNTLGKVTLASAIPVSSVSIDNGTVVTSNTVQYSAIISPSDATDKSVSWAIVSGGEYATIDSTGLLTVLPGASSSTVVIHATSVGTPSVSGYKTIIVTYSGVSYDVIYQKDSLSGTASDFVQTEFKLHSDENDKWSMFILIPPLSVNASFGNNMACLVSSNQQLSSPWDGLSVAVNTGKLMFPGIVDSIGTKTYINPVTGTTTTGNYPSQTTDNKSHCLAISRDGTNYKYSMDGETWSSLCSYTPTSEAKNAIMEIGGSTISGNVVRFPKSSSPAVVALVLGTKEYSFPELFEQYATE